MSSWTRHLAPADTRWSTSTEATSTYHKRLPVCRLLYVVSDCLYVVTDLFSFALPYYVCYSYLTLPAGLT